MSDPLRINLDELEDRFSRFRLIGWWDQARLRSAKVLVIGAGALGNEIVKNLALLGVGRVLVCDKDRIEHSNLSRSVLYRAADAGRAKAVVAVEAARQIYPEITAHAFDGDIVHDLGLGVFRWADVILGGLDNRLARLTINRHCHKVGRPWIDGAIEQIQGVARVFEPSGACYECTMSQRDWQTLQARRSCNLLSRKEMEHGKTPTTPTISSIIAGVQCQEAVKLLHGLPTIAGKGWVFDGLSTEAYQTEYQRKPDCLSHDRLDRVESIEVTGDGVCFDELFDAASTFAGERVRALELSRDVLEAFVCPQCGREEIVLESLGKVAAERAFCPDCTARTPAGEGRVERQVRTLNRVLADGPHGRRTPAQLGLPGMDIVVARTSGGSIGLELSGDAPKVLGGLCDGGLELV